MTAPLEALELLREALEGLAASLSAGSATAAAAAVTRALEFCEALKAEDVQLPRERIAELTDIHERCRATAARLEERLEAAQHALSVSRRAATAYATSGG